MAFQQTIPFLLKQPRLSRATRSSGGEALAFPEMSEGQGRGVRRLGSLGFPGSGFGWPRWFVLATALRRGHRRRAWGGRDTQRPPSSTPPAPAPWAGAPRGSPGVRAAARGSGAPWCPGRDGPCSAALARAAAPLRQTRFRKRPPDSRMGHLCLRGGQLGVPGCSRAPARSVRRAHGRGRPRVLEVTLGDQATAPAGPLRVLSVTLPPSGCACSLRCPLAGTELGALPAPNPAPAPAVRGDGATPEHSECEVLGSAPNPR